MSFIPTAKGLVYNMDLFVAQPPVNHSLSAATPHKYWVSLILQLIQTRKVLFALWCSPVISVLEQFVFELLCMNLLCFHLIVLSFYCQ